MVGVAQLVRAPDCDSGGRGFETHLSPTQVIGFLKAYFACFQRYISQNNNYIINFLVFRYGEKNRIFKN